MALLTCPECGKQVSDQAQTCPNCGYPFKSNAPEPVTYETKVVKIRCWGRGQGSINNKLHPYTSAGWNVVTMVEDHWQGGLISPVYKVTLRRAKNTKLSTLTPARKTCPFCGDVVTSSVCNTCGKTNNLF